MTTHIPDKALDLFQKATLGHLATLMPDGSPQVTPVWVDFDGTYLLVNTIKGTRKEINMHQRAQVAIDLVDPDDPFHFLSVRGRIAEITEAGAEEHIDRMAKRYMGTETYQWRKTGEIRQLCKILPEHVSTD